MIKRRYYLQLLLALAVVCSAASIQARTFLYVSLASDNGLAVYEVNETTGKLKYLRLHDLGTDPGPMSVSVDRKTIYVALRNAGKLASFSLSPGDGVLKHLTTVAAEPDPAYHWPDVEGRYLLSAYYRTGKVALHQLDSRGAILSAEVQWHPTALNAHGIAVDKANRKFYVTHTGPNAIYQFDLDPSGKSFNPAAHPVVRTPEKTGPRHIALHPSKPFAYADNEQGSSVTVYRFDSGQGTLVAVQTVSTLPAEGCEGNSNAQIHIHPSGKSLYVSNRGHNSIAM